MHQLLGNNPLSHLSTLAVQWVLVKSHQEFRKMLLYLKRLELWIANETREKTCLCSQQLCFVKVCRHCENNIEVLLYLSQKWSDCHETKSKHINWNLGPKCDHYLWPWPWHWPWIFKVKHRICYISAKICQLNFRDIIIMQLSVDDNEIMASR